MAPSKRLQAKYPKGETVQQIYGKGGTPRRKVYIQKDGADDRCKGIAEEMEKHGLTTSCLYKSLTVDTSDVILPPQQSTIDQPIPAEIKVIFFTGGLVQARVQSPSEGDEEYYFTKVACTDDERYEIFKTTIGQASNLESKTKWFAARKNRVSASTARAIGWARGTAVCSSEKMALKYFYGSDFDTPNFRYGREMEPEARAEYSSDNDVTVHQSGLIISHHYPWLCASPDGLVVMPDGEVIILEIKCPVKGRDQVVHPDYIKDGKLQSGHAYYSQVQIQMFAANAKMTHFYVYGRKNQILVHVPRDDAFM